MRPRFRSATDRKKVVLLPHVGVAFSHVLRAIALSGLLDAQFDVLLAVPSKARTFLATYLSKLQCRPILWPYEHNDALVGGLSDTVSALHHTARQLEAICEQFSPDVVIGIPGFHSSFLCDYLGVPHISVLHGPWLTPEYDLADLTPGESAVFQSWERSIQISDTLVRIIAHAFEGNYRGYRDWLDRQQVLVAQEFSVTYRRSRPSAGFLSSDFGPTSIEGLPDNCLTVSFGTAVEKIAPHVLDQASRVGLPIVAVGGSPVNNYGITHVPAIAGSQLAEIATLAVTHGGIGTIPVFARAGVPQVFVPHEIDGAVNSILARRSEWGSVVPLNHWSDRGPFGRLSPPIADGVLTEMCQSLVNTIIPATVNAAELSDVPCQVAQMC